jgi:hypothetical protein
MGDEMGRYGAMSKDVQRIVEEMKLRGMRPWESPKPSEGQWVENVPMHTPIPTKHCLPCPYKQR